MNVSEQAARAMAGRAVVLALVAGFVDAFTLLHLGVFSSFMSGNTTSAGLNTGTGQFTLAWPHLLAIPLFVLGAGGGAFLLHSGLGRPLRWLCGIVAILLSAGLATTVIAAPVWMNIILFATAMGVLNSTITRVGGQSLGVGYLTGDLNKLGGHIALALRGVPVADAHGGWDSHAWRAALLGSVWAFFFLGAVLAGLAMAHLGAWVLLAPVLVLILVATVFSGSKS